MLLGLASVRMHERRLLLIGADGSCEGIADAGDRHDILRRVGLGFDLLP